MANNRRTPIFIACERGDLSLVQALVERGRANTNSSAALLIAIDQGYDEIVDYLIRRCNVHEMGYFEQLTVDNAIAGVLMRAIDLGQSDRIQMILDKISRGHLHSTIVHSNNWSNPPSLLTLACAREDLNLVRLLVERCNV
ncbi:unnamed protein product [Rotaria sp. Silwood2]|nr:unnamed protein product [Rotaria sp. Silwood2]